MVNKNYEKGRRLEWNIIKYAKKKGLKGMRSAKSGGAIDVVIIDENKKIIYFVQAKAKKMSANAVKKELKALPREDEYITKNLVITKTKEFRKIIDEGFFGLKG